MARCVRHPGSASLALVLAVAVCGGARSAAAFDFFGLFGGDDKPPAVSTEAIPYSLDFSVAGDPSGVADALRDASVLYSLRKDAPPDGDSLARRAERDFAPLVDALWARGYFNTTLTLSLDGAVLPPRGEAPGFARAAERHRNRDPAPIKIAADPGPLFKLRRIDVLGPDGRTPLTQAEAPSRILALEPGDPAVADSVRAAEARLVDYFRSQSRPLAKIAAVRPVIDHPAAAMDLTIVVDPGPVAAIGEITVKGPATIPEPVIRSFVYLEKGEPYSPDALDRSKASVRTIPAVGGARFVEGVKLDALGELPLELQVTDRLQHAFGVSAQYSTIDGPIGQLYWEHRNLFGGAEYLRLQADLLYAPSNLAELPPIDSLGHSPLGGRLGAHFVKPALLGTRNDLLVDVVAERIGTSFGNYVGFLADDVDATAAIRHRFSDQLTAQIGVEARKGVADDILGKVNYTLLGVPASLSYDSTDDKLNPTRGVRATAMAAAYPRFLGSSLNLVTERAAFSAYRALDESARFIVAGRVEFAGESGADLAAIPANLRYYAGGGGTVRGYPYDSLGPLVGNAVIGGASLFDASLELRARVTPTIGIVPFFDAGNAFSSPLPNFSRPLQMAGGVGLRYYTALGPLRLDIATPINPRAGDPRFAVYAGIGHAF